MTCTIRKVLHLIRRSGRVAAHYDPFEIDSSGGITAPNPAQVVLTPQYGETSTPRETQRHMLPNSFGTTGCHTALIHRKDHNKKGCTQCRFPCECRSEGTSVQKRKIKKVEKMTGKKHDSKSTQAPAEGRIDRLLDEDQQGLGEALRGTRGEQHTPDVRAFSKRNCLPACWFSPVKTNRWAWFVRCVHRACEARKLGKS